MVEKMINDHYLINILNYLGDDKIDISHINNKLLLYIFENRDFCVELELPLSITKEVRFEKYGLLIYHDEYNKLVLSKSIIKTTFVGGLIECALAHPYNEVIKSNILSVFNAIKKDRNLADLFNQLCDEEKVFIKVLNRASNCFMDLNFIQNKWIYDFCIKNKASLENANKNDDVLPFLLVRNRNWSLLEFLLLSTPTIVNEKNGNGVKFSIFMEKYISSSLQLDKKLEVPQEIVSILSKNYLDNSLSNIDDDFGSTFKI